MKKTLYLLALLVCCTQAFSQTCSVSFSTNASPSGNQLLRVQINNTTSVSVGSPSHVVSFLVRWGDATTNTVSTGTSSHTYGLPSVYTISLIKTITDTVTSSLICIDSSQQTITLAYPPCGTTLTVNSVTPTGNVSVSANTPATTTGMTYTWNWGDGSTNSTGATATHTYNSTGLYTVTLTATNGTCSYTNSTTVNIVSTCGGLTTNSSATVSGYNVDFTDNSFCPPSKYKVSQWVYGDGSYYDGAHSARSYTPGTYNAILYTYWFDTLSTSALMCQDSNLHVINITASPGNTISGYLRQDSTSNITSPQYKVWLIQHDTITNNLFAVDSVIITGGSIGYTTFYQFNNKAAGLYRVKAKLLNGPTSGMGAIPTYYPDKLLWSQATIINHSGGASINKDIRLQYGTVVSGPGFVSGNVLAGANKGTASGIPGMTVIAYDTLNKAIAFATTDASGYYKLSNLPTGKYHIYPEDAGYTTTKATISITNTNTTIAGTSFIRSFSNKTIKPFMLNIPTAGTQTFEIYPNPAKDRIYVRWYSPNKQNVNVILSNITGKVIQHVTRENIGGNEIIFTQLQPGLYFITTESDNNKQTHKVIVQ